MIRRLVSRWTRPAPTRSRAANMAWTALQIVVFWSFFLGLLPLAIRLAEGAAGVAPFEFTGRRAAGAALFGAASLLGLWSGATMSALGEGTPLPTSCARRLVVAGPYRYLRNPMALAGIAQGLAVGVFTGSTATVAYALAGALVWHHGARPPEEADLERRFGEDFRRYRAAVRCWVPRLVPYRP